MIKNFDKIFPLALVIAGAVVAVLVITLPNVILARLLTLEQLLGTVILIVTGKKMNLNAIFVMIFLDITK